MPLGFFGRSARPAPSELDKDKQAELALIRAVKVPGLLRIITNVCANPGCPPDGHIANPHPPTDPRHFVIHDVVSIERHPTRSEFMVASSAEGDYCLGRPAVLLRRLQEANLV